MDIYVDGSTRTARAMLQAKKKYPEGCGFAVVTDDTIYIKRFKIAEGLRAAGVTYMESAALIYAMKLAKCGDTVFSDQGAIFRRFEDEGGMQEVKSVRARTHAMQRCIDRLLNAKGGITYLYQNSKKAKSLPREHPARLVDIAAKVGSGVEKHNKLIPIKGNRKVVYL